MKTDHQTYHDLQAAMKCMTRAGMFNTMAFQDAWQMSEKIKSKYGGLPPPPDDIDFLDQELAEIGVESGLR